MLEYPAENDLLFLSTQGILNPSIKARIYQLRRFLDRLNQESAFNPKFLTIGEFYHSIIEKMWDIYDQYGQEGQKKLFSGDSRKQFTIFTLPQMHPIYDFRTAMNQIRIVVEEG